MMGLQTAVVVADYETPYAEPFSLRAGDELAVSDRQSEWPGWLWCTDSHGQARWVPAAYLERRGAMAIAQRDYEATELPARAGQVVTLGTRESGWIWCTDESGRSGWLPAEHLDLGLREVE